jgi:hypothetical protein
MPLQRASEGLPARERPGLRGQPGREPGKILGESERGVVAMAGLPLETAGDDGLQISRGRGDERPEARSFLVDDLEEQLGGRARMERSPPREELEERDAERVDVGAAVDALVLPERLLGRHVGGRSDDEPGHGQRGRRGLLAGEAEVQDHGPLILGSDHDVVGLEIAMDEPGPVRRVKRLGHPPHDVDLLFRAERPRRLR